MLKAMLARAREVRAAELEGEEAAEAGFTLIELMVVLLILAILMAIAIPTFLGVTSGANDRAAQSNLTNALTEATAIYQANQQTFTGLTTQDMGSSASEFSWTQGSCTNKTTNCMSYAVYNTATAGDGDTLVLADYSQTGKCWYAVVNEVTPVSGVSGALTSGPTTAGTNYSWQTAPSGGCTATDPSATSWTWYPSYGAAKSSQ